MRIVASQLLMLLPVVVADCLVVDLLSGFTWLSHKLRSQRWNHVPPLPPLPEEEDDACADGCAAAGARYHSSSPLMKGVSGAEQQGAPVAGADEEENEEGNEEEEEEEEGKTGALLAVQLANRAFSGRTAQEGHSTAGPRKNPRRHHGRGETSECRGATAAEHELQRTKPLLLPPLLPPSAGLRDLSAGPSRQVCTRCISCAKKKSHRASSRHKDAR